MRNRKLIIDEGLAKDLKIFNLNLRKRYGLTQAEFGNKIGYARSRVARVENGSQYPRVRYLRAVSGAFSLSPREQVFLSNAIEKLEKDNPIGDSCAKNSSAHELDGGNLNIVINKSGYEIFNLIMTAIPELSVVSAQRDTTDKYELELSVDIKKLNKRLEEQYTKEIKSRKRNTASVDDVCSLFKNGKNVGEIAAELGISERTVYRKLEVGRDGECF